MRRCVVLMLPLLLSLIAGTQPVEAQTRLPVPCGDGLPCYASSSGIPGHIDAVRGAQLPWVASIPVSAGTCFIAQLYAADRGIHGVDISVIAPDGIVFRSGTHLVGHRTVIVYPTVAGWYTVQYDSTPPGLEQLFTLNFGFEDPSTDLSCKEAVTSGM